MQSFPKSLISLKGTQKIQQNMGFGVELGSPARSNKRCARGMAEIQGANDQKIGALQTALDDLSRTLEEKTKGLAGEV